LSIYGQEKIGEEKKAEGKEGEREALSFSLII
jgi:hypothetical protein